MEGALTPGAERVMQGSLRPVKAAAVTPPSQPRGWTGFLSDVIVELGYVDMQTAEWAVEQGRVLGQTVGRVLIESRILSEDQLSRAIAELHGLDHVDLEAFDVDLDVARLISRQAARRYHAVPIAFDSDGSLIVALADPVDPLAVSDIAVMTKSEVRPMVAAESAIDEIVEQLRDVPAPSSDPEPPPADRTDHRTDGVASEPDDPIVDAPESIGLETPASLEAPPAHEPARHEAADLPAPAVDVDGADLPQELAGVRSALERLAERVESEARTAALGEEIAAERDALRDDVASGAEERDELRRQLEQAELRANAANASLAELRSERERDREDHESLVRQLRSDLDKAKQATRRLEQRLAAVMAATAEIRTACEKLAASQSGDELT